MTCFVCGEDITSREQEKPFGMCDECLEAMEENKPPSIANYWTCPKTVQDWLREYALNEGDAARRRNPAASYHTRETRGKPGTV